MRLLPKDPYDASMSKAHLSMRSAKQRRKAYAIERNAMGYEGPQSHERAVKRAYENLPVRYHNKVERLLDEYHGKWEFLRMMRLPTRQKRFINAVITAHYVDMAMRHDEMLYRNMF